MAAGDSLARRAGFGGYSGGADLIGLGLLSLLPIACKSPKARRLSGSATR